MDAVKSGPYVRRNASSFIFRRAIFYGNFDVPVLFSEGIQHKSNVVIKLDV